jgi:hypothetical protein
MKWKEDNDICAIVKESMACHMTGLEEVALTREYENDKSDN